MHDRSSFLGAGTKELLGVESDDQIKLLSEWSQRGSETFSCDFMLNDGDEIRHLIAKACIKYCPVETVDEWMARRSTLEQAGISVPKLFKRDGATIIEEFIPFSLEEAYRSGDSVQQDALESTFVSTYTSAARAGFWPLSLHDARSRGGDIVMIDMGEDIGGPHQVDLDAIEVHRLAQNAFARIIHR